MSQMDKNKLNLDLDEIRHIPLPPLDYTKDITTSSRKITGDEQDDIRHFFDAISTNGKIDPQELRNHLRRVGNFLRNIKFNFLLKKIYDFLVYFSVILFMKN